MVNYQPMTDAEWTAVPKADFQRLIKRWCSRHDFTELLPNGEKIPAKLPYHRGNKDNGEDPTKIYAATDFLAIVEQHQMHSQI